MDIPLRLYDIAPTDPRTLFGLVPGIHVAGKNVHEAVREFLGQGVFE